MKKLLGILVLGLLLITPSQADDISDFQIEGISIGDSLLDYFSEEEIKKNSKNFFKNKTFTPFEVYKQPFFKVYEFVGSAFKTEDKNYIIHQIKGIIEYPKDIESCYKKMNEISKELSEMFKYEEGLKVVKPRDVIFYGLEESNESKYSIDQYTFKSGDEIQVGCYDYSKKTPYIDALQVIIYTKEYSDFLDVAYK